MIKHLQELGLTRERGEGKGNAAESKTKKPKSK